VRDDKQQSGAYFQLRAFSPGPLEENLSFGGSLIRISGGLVVQFRLQGALEDINLSSMSSMSTVDHAGRRDELWRHTCFELFFAIPDRIAYWELNLCPSGGWNIYYFSGYRTGMRKERMVAPPLCRVVKDADVLSMTCTINFGAIIDDACALAIGVAGVIEAADGRIGYWALDHPGREPDFHNRRGFLLALPGVSVTNSRGDSHEKSCPARL
jgi:hypothetical protein